MSWAIAGMSGGTAAAGALCVHKELLWAALGQGVALCCWLVLLAAARDSQISRAKSRFILFATIVTMGVFSLCDPVLSSDIHRYIYEGRVVWTHGPVFPFLAAPQNAAVFGVDPVLFDHHFAQINHPSLPTIYPPVAQIVFALAGGFGSTQAALKLLLSASAVALVPVLRRAPTLGSRPAVPVIIAACPLLVFETAFEGHADALAAVFLGAGAVAFSRSAPAAGYRYWALAALAKLNGLIALLAAVRATRRGLVWVSLLLILTVPYGAAVLSGAQTGIGAYAGSWQAGDGVFSVALAAAEWALDGDWRRFGAVTISRHELARAGVALAWGIFAIATLWRPVTKGQVGDRAGQLLLVLLLLSPTLHPWYACWLLPFIPFLTWARPAALLLVVFVGLNHHSAYLQALDGEWREYPLMTALVHVPVWALVGMGWLRERSRRARDLPTEHR